MLQEMKSIEFRYRMRKQHVYTIGAMEVMDYESSSFAANGGDIWSPISALVVRVANDLEELKWYLSKFQFTK